jgi:hypothetical protein
VKTHPIGAFFMKYPSARLSAHREPLSFHPIYGKPDVNIHRRRQHTIVIIVIFE